MQTTKTPLVELHNVHKKYQLGETEVHALRGISMQLHQGEFISLIGASGSGKSTLLNLVGCIDEPTSGSIHLESHDVSTFSESEKAHLRSQKIGFVFQTFNLIPVLDVFENIELPLLIHKTISVKDRRDIVLRTIKEVDLESFLKHRPDKLSGGQRQRVAIARALVNKPRLVIADEPTANLDSHTAHRIMDLLLKLNQERQVTFLFSTHDEKLMSRVSRTIRIQDGQIQT